MSSPVASSPSSLTLSPIAPSPSSSTTARRLCIGHGNDTIATRATTPSRRRRSPSRRRNHRSRRCPSCRRHHRRQRQDACASVVTATMPSRQEQQRFLTQTTLIRHLHSPTHATTHHLVNHTLCATAGIYTCCKSSCPASPKIFFSSLRALHDHGTTIHPPPPSPPPTPNIPPSTPFAISSHLLHCHPPPHTVNHWMHGLDFITSVYDHEPPDFRTTWRHFLRSRNKSAFCNLQASIIRAIVVSNTSCPTIDDTAPFWWLLLHLDMLSIFAPSTRKQRSDSSIQNTISDCIDVAFSGDVTYLFNSAMNVKRLTQNTRPAYIGKSCSAQLAAGNDEYHTAVSLCSSQSVAIIGSHNLWHNISHINKLYPTSPPSKPSTAHTILIISTILPHRRHLQNHPPKTKEQE